MWLAWYCQNGSKVSGGGLISLFTQCHFACFVVHCFLQWLGYSLRAGSLLSPLCDKNSWCSLLLAWLKWLWGFSCAALGLTALLNRAPLSWALAVLVPPGQVWMSLAKQPEWLNDVGDVFCRAAQQTQCWHYCGGARERTSVWGRTFKQFCCQACPPKVNSPVLAQCRIPRKSFRKVSPSALGRFFTAKLWALLDAFWHFNHTGKKRAVQLVL